MGFDIVGAVNTRYPQLKTQGWVDFNKNGKKEENEELKPIYWIRYLDRYEDDMAYYNFLEANRKYIDGVLLNKAVSSNITILMTDGDKIFRERAAGALGKLKDPSAVFPLIDALSNDRNRSVRATSAWSLGELKDPRAVPPLIEALKATEHVRRSAVVALGKLEDPRAFIPLTEVMNNESEDIKYSLVRSDALDVLMESKDSRAIPALIEALNNNKDFSIRRKIAYFLGKKEDTRAVMPLIEALHDGDWGVREESAVALGKLQDPRAFIPLTEVMNNESEDQTVRKAARDALSKIRCSCHPRFKEVIDPGCRVVIDR